jgi:hypothetical protein
MLDFAICRIAWVGGCGGGVAEGLGAAARGAGASASTQSGTDGAPSRTISLRAGTPAIQSH